MGVYTGTPALPPFLAGDVPSAATDWAAIIAALNALSTAWTAYTPTWASFGTQPVISNGTLAGKHARIGKFEAFSIDLVIGSTTTFGTNLYTLSLPSTVASNGVCSAYFEDNSTGFRYAGAAGILSGGSILNPIVFTNATSGFSATSPVTVATSDVARFSGVYEAA
jgi:hypothetical protein